MMLVTSKKIKTANVPKNACPNCDGVGQIQMIGSVGEFLAECSNCNGEKIITPDLLERKRLGKVLKEMMREKGLAMREAVKISEGEFIDWNNAIQGRNSVEDIQAKIELLRSR